MPPRRCDQDLYHIEIPASYKVPRTNDCLLLKPIQGSASFLGLPVGWASRTALAASPTEKKMGRASFGRGSYQSRVASSEVLNEHDTQALPCLSRAVQIGCQKR